MNSGIMDNGPQHRMLIPILPIEYREINAFNRFHNTMDLSLHCTMYLQALNMTTGGVMTPKSNVGCQLTLPVDTNFHVSCHRKLQVKIFWVRFYHFEIFLKGKIYFPFTFKNPDGKLTDIYGSKGEGL